MTSRRVALASLFMLAATSLVLSGCSSHPDPWAKQPGPPRVVVTVPALYSFVKQVGGDHVGVICLCTKDGPHHYVPNADDAIALRKANLLLGIGLELDEVFMEKLKKNSGNDNLKIVELGEKSIEDENLIHRDKKAREAEHEGHKHGAHDPHVWLGIDTAKAMVQGIAKELKEVDGARADEYQKNADAYCAKLDELRKEYKPKLDKKNNKRILPLHDSLRYFGRSFNLDIEDAIEVTPNEEPSARQYAQLVEKCSDSKPPITVIATEPQFMAKAAETIRAELKNRKIDIELIEIDPLETADPAKLSADWYIEMMEKNLKTLVEKLDKKK